MRGGEKNNILLIVLDACRADFLGVYGNENGYTPSIDKIAEESIVFLNAYSPGPHTSISLPRIFSGNKRHLPVGPWRGNILDIRRNYKRVERILRRFRYFMNFEIYQILRALKNSFSFRLKKTKSKVIFLRDSIIERFRMKYFTVLVGANPFLNYGFQRGFDEFHELFYEKYNYNKLKLKYDYPFTVPPEDIYNLFKKLFELYPENSFFYLHFFQPHHPYVSPQSSVKIRSLDILRLKFRLMRDGKISEDTIEKLKKAYGENLRWVDRYIGRIFNFLENQSDDFLFIITSDHGEEFGERGYIMHEIFRFTKELLHVPLIIYDSNGKKRKSILRKYKTHNLLRDIIGGTLIRKLKE